MMLLRLAPEDMTRPIDFREGRWGHRLHADLFRPADAKNFVQAWLDRRNNVRRYSFLCHSADTPVIGRAVIWTSKMGDREGTIYRIEPMGNPRDMFTLYVTVAGGVPKDPTNDPR